MGIRDWGWLQRRIGRYRGSMPHARVAPVPRPSRLDDFQGMWVATIGDEIVAAKLRAVLRNGMTPICCVGEAIDEREIGMTKDLLATQVESALGGLPPETVAGVVIAYEPLWAIGTGQAATPEDAQEACQWIREVVGRSATLEAAGQIRVQYGGSVDEDNSQGLLSGPDVDGALVGGASLDMAKFLGIIRAAARTAR